MKLLQDLHSGDPLLAFEAAKKLPDVKRRPVRELVEILFHGTAPHAQEAAAYALSNMHGRRHPAIYPALLRMAGDRRQPVEVRGQAFEGIAYHNRSRQLQSHHRPWRNHPWWPRTLKVLRSGLADPSAAVTFWACFAAGQSSAQELMPVLTRIRDHDRRMNPGWWPVADEAADAICDLKGLPRPDRVPQGAGSQPQDHSPR